MKPRRKIYKKLELFDCCAVDGDASAQASLGAQVVNSWWALVTEFLRRVSQANDNNQRQQQQPVNTAR